MDLSYSPHAGGLTRSIKKTDGPTVKSNTKQITVRHGIQLCEAAQYCSRWVCLNPMEKTKKFGKTTNKKRKIGSKKKQLLPWKYWPAHATTEPQAAKLMNQTNPRNQKNHLSNSPWEHSKNIPSGLASSL